MSIPTGELDVFDVSIDPFGRSGHHVEALEERVLDGNVQFREQSRHRLEFDVLVEVLLERGVVRVDRREVVFPGVVPPEDADRCGAVAVNDIEFGERRRPSGEGIR